MLVLPEDIKHTPRYFRTNNPHPFKTHNETCIDTNGTCGQGSICTTYDELVKQFGQPMLDQSADGKVRAEWAIRLDDKYGTVITIYDWKQTIPVEEVTRWNIGGFRGAMVNVQITMANMLQDNPTNQE